MDTMDTAAGTNGHLSARQAADVLGCSPRTVRRAIEQGRLVGTLHPCRTTTEACRAYRARQQGISGEVLAGSDSQQGARERGVSAPAESEREVLLYALREIERLALQLGRREAEVEGLGREVAALHAHLSPLGSRPSPRQGQRASVLGRLGPWLRR